MNKTSELGDEGGLTSDNRMTEASLKGDAQAFAAAYLAKKDGLCVQVDRAFVLQKLGRNNPIFAHYDFMHDLLHEVFSRSDNFTARDDLWMARLANDDSSFAASIAEQGSLEEVTGLVTTEARVHNTMTRFAIETALRVGIMMGAETTVEHTHEG